MPPLLTFTPGCHLSPNRRRKICSYARDRPTSNPNVLPPPPPPGRFGECPPLGQASAWPNGTPKARRQAPEDRGRSRYFLEAEGGRASGSPRCLPVAPGDARPVLGAAASLPAVSARVRRAGLQGRDEPPRPVRPPRAPGPDQRCLVAGARGTVLAGRLRAGVAGPPLLTPESTGVEARGAQTALECVCVRGRGTARVRVLSLWKWSGVASGEFTLGSFGLVLGLWCGSEF